MRLPHFGHDRSVQFNVTPLIDVVFLLIIFFMTTAQFARMTRAEVELPEQPGEEDTDESSAALIVNIQKSGPIIFENEAISLDRPSDMVAAETAANADIQRRVRAAPQARAG